MLMNLSFLICNKTIMLVIDGHMRVEDDEKTIFYTSYICVEKINTFQNYAGVK